MSSFITGVKQTVQYCYYQSNIAKALRPRQVIGNGAEFIYLYIDHPLISPFKDISCKKMNLEEAGTSSNCVPAKEAVRVSLQLAMKPTKSSNPSLYKGY